VLREPANRAEESASLAACPDGGFIVHGMGFVNTGTMAYHRLVKLDARGHVQWNWHAPKGDGVRRPQFLLGQLTPQGTFEIDGYIQTEKDGPVRAWTAEISADGKTLRDEIGSVEQGHKNSMP
jgi:hypothetical protein